MSKAQKWKQQQKQAKLGKNATPSKKIPPEELESNMSKRQKEQQANKEALRKHQASQARLKQLEAKLHPERKEQESKTAESSGSSALADMMFDGSNLGKDLSRTSFKK